MLGYAAKYVLQIDTTYKLDQSGYPVLVIGFSDQSQSFDPLVMFVTFQQTGDLISIARQSVFDVFKGITGDYPDIRYCVAGADKAQYNVVMDTTSSKRSHNSNGALTYLMCFFHVVKNVADRVSSFPMEVVLLVFKHLCMIHYSRDSVGFNTRKEVALAEWKAYPVLDSFAAHFKKQWIDSPFSNWGCYHTNRICNDKQPRRAVQQRDQEGLLTRTLIKLVALAEQLFLMYRHRSRGTFVFTVESKPNRELHDLQISAKKWPT
ncbi:hypothetical protein L914_21555 [Phytophthora nicotianae]|uniref:MULE transposase domain-containing protein n=2 Tax=Phytophthora nicotianae TaxID=4792 RepID=V9FFY9_PHYNI|nr:hypothetical protein F443_06505 [Phytophthora nicotianae P1569]ETM30770.1 hypothetical protein L914_21555 [Phytophthora nicotianae]